MTDTLEEPQEQYPELPVEPEREPWSLAQQPHQPRVGMRRKRDLVIHMLVMRLRSGFECNLPYDHLRAIAEELGERIEHYNDQERNHAKTTHDYRRNAGDHDNDQPGAEGTGQ